MSERKWRWVSRDGVNAVCPIWVWTSEERPVWDDELGVYVYGDDMDGEIVHICEKEFAAIFGFVLEPRACVKVEFTARIVEE
jgi:hypothetical protein